MNKRDFRLIRIHRVAGNYMIFHNDVLDIYLKIKVLKATEKSHKESKIRIRFIIKDEFPIRYKKDYKEPYYIDAEKIKELTIFTEEAANKLRPKGILGVVDGIIEVQLARDEEGPYSYYSGFYRCNPSFIAVCKSE